VPLLQRDGIGVQREVELSYLPGPRSTPSLHPEDRHHAGDTHGQQRQCIKRPLTPPQGVGTGVQGRGVEVPFLPWEVIVAKGLGELLCSPDGTAVEVDQSPIWLFVPNPRTCKMSLGERHLTDWQASDAPGGSVGVRYPSRGRQGQSRQPVNRGFSTTFSARSRRGSVRLS
jgi:hypothetical protein